jgi:hypothetical protein
VRRHLLVATISFRGRTTTDWPLDGGARYPWGALANFGVGLAEKLKSSGIAHEQVYPCASNVKHKNGHEYLLAKLKGPR